MSTVIFDCDGTLVDSEPLERALLGDAHVVVDRLSTAGVLALAA